MLRAVAFSILADIPSAPVALVESSEQMRSSTWSSVHKNSSGKLNESSDLRLQISPTVKTRNRVIEIAENLIVKNVRFLHIFCDYANVGSF